ARFSRRCCRSAPAPARGGEEPARRRKGRRVGKQKVLRIVPGERPRAFRQASSREQPRTIKKRGPKAPLEVCCGSATLRPTPFSRNHRSEGSTHRRVIVDAVAVGRVARTTTTREDRGGGWQSARSRASAGSDSLRVVAGQVVGHRADRRSSRVSAD